jgi:hypothetical protein
MKMSKRASLAVLLTAIAFAVAALVLTPAGEAVARTMRPLLVRVVNDGSNPVPVTGVASITGTADVNVTNAPDVNIANHPTVDAHILSGSFVGIDPANNTVQLAKACVTSCGTPFQATLGASFGVDLPAPSSFTVPADRRLIIEYVSGNCEGSDDSSGASSIGLTARTGAAPVLHHLPFTPLPSPGSVEVQHTFAQSTRIYADAGTTVSFGGRLFRSAAGTVSCLAAVSGTLVAP